MHRASTGPPGDASVQPKEASQKQGKKRRVSEGTNERKCTGVSKQGNPGFDATPSGPASVPGLTAGTPSQQEVVNGNDRQVRAPLLVV
jgi:hypothetical protein